MGLQLQPRTLSERIDQNLNVTPRDALNLKEKAAPKVMTVVEVVVIVLSSIVESEIVTTLLLMTMKSGWTVAETAILSEKL